jgi:hypothetical protein
MACSGTARTQSLKRTIREWARREHQGRWQSRHAMSPFLSCLPTGMSIQVIGLFKQETHLKGHLVKPGTTHSLVRGRCPDETEAASQTVCGRQALAALRYHCVEPRDYWRNEVGVAQHIRKLSRCKGRC